MYQPKLSVITINFNNAEGLKKTIESVVFQTFTNFEYIIIDGGSTDGSVDIIKQYADKITYWVSEQDTGIYNAMNKGILQAKGEYLNFMNSGDYFYNHDVLYNIFEKNSYNQSIITGNKIHVLWNKQEEYSPGVSYKPYGKVTILSFLKGSFSHQSSFIKRQLFEQYGLYSENYKIVSDWIFFLQTIGLYCVDVKLIDDIIVFYDITGISADVAEKHRERKRAAKEFIPESILQDYLYFQNLEKQYQYIFKYKFTHGVAFVVNKIIRILHRPLRRFRRKTI